MKQLFIALMVAFTFSTLTWGQTKDTILRDSIGKAKITITKTTPDAPKTEIDPESGLEYTDVVDSTRSDSYNFGYDLGHEISETFKDSGLTGIINGGMVFVIFIIVITFGFPIIIVFLAFYFRYKNKKAKYKLIEQALASGQPLPENLLEKEKEHDYRAAGIKNTFLGLGLFVFLWAVSGFAVGCIGLLIMCIGLGKWITAVDKDRSNKEK